MTVLEKLLQLGVDATQECREYHDWGRTRILLAENRQGRWAENWRTVECLDRLTNLCRARRQVSSLWLANSNLEER